jgi:hypothetical protein
MAADTVTDLLSAVRDSKDPAGPKLIFTLAEWRAFVAGVLPGEVTRSRALRSRALQSHVNHLVATG